MKVLKCTLFGLPWPTISSNWRMVRGNIFSYSKSAIFSPPCSPLASFMEIENISYKLALPFQKLLEFFGILFSGYLGQDDFLV
jgi:hypothetical protein